MNADHIHELDVIMLPLTGIFDGILCPHCQQADVLESGLIFAALSATAQLPVTPHLITDYAAGSCGSSVKGIIATFAKAVQGQRITVEEVVELTGAIVATGQNIVSAVS